ncbi:MAG: CO/xanthine dehydrogenase Mo-binding subunit [Yoonia sp.]|jgi:CO/xanthine dehydrogenase Mo-binding subunit
MNVPPPIKNFPLIRHWLSFGLDGGVDLLSGRVELGQGITTALMQIAADELDVSLTAIRLTQGHTGLSPAEGPTVGSLSVTFGGQSIRLAASAARALMLGHAAGLLQTTSNHLDVRNGMIINDGLETGLGYASLCADVDLNVSILAHAAPKIAADRKVTGASVPRVDLAARLTSGFLLHDFEVDGMWHGRVIQPPSLDATVENLVDSDLHGDVQLVREGQFFAVVAEDEYLALSEARRLAAQIEWKRVSTCPVHPSDGLDGQIVESETLYDSDGLDAGVTEVSVTVTKPALSHGSIGPSCSVAKWDGDTLTIWAHSQNVFALKESLARVLNHPAEQITVIFVPGAGCYGHNSSDDVALDAALMARATGRPVRALWQRQDEFLHGPLNPAMKAQMIARLDEDGRIVSYDALVTSPPHSTRPAGSEEPNLRAQQFLPHAMSMGPGNDAPQPQGGADRNAVPGYAIPAVRVVRKRPAYVPYRPSAMRGLGAFTNVIALEQLMESCAEAAVQDSIAYRLSHLEDPRAIAVIETVRDMVGPRHDAEDVGYGLGYAQYKNSAGYLACIARVVVGDEVRVTDVWSAADVGEAISPDGTINQIEGGIVQAISWVLKEEVTFAGGQNLTKSWDDYPILRFSEVPRMKTRLIGPQDAPPLGAGEISSGPAGAAVVNAVRHVLGVVPDRLPLSRHALVTMLS